MSSAHTVQDNVNDSHSSASDASEDEAHSRISRDHDPEVENLTSYSGVDDARRGAGQWVWNVLSI